MPSMLLQPLVENAIKHGVARKAGPGHIDISARRDGDKLLLEVRDDGMGLSEDALTALQKGIGVSTTRARLQHLFGADYRFEFHRLAQGPWSAVEIGRVDLAQGLAVIVAVPWHTGHLAPAPVETSAPPSAETRQRSVFNTFSSMAGGSLLNTSLFRRKTS